MKALYIGSFDPFTNGHYEILKQTEQLFDDVILGICENPTKKRRFSTGLCINAIEPYVGKNTVVALLNPMDLAPELAKLNNCDYIIRGLRNTSDYLYEENLYNMYKEINPDVKVLYLRGNNISSTMVYELYKRDRDISKYIPYEHTQLNALTVKWNK